MNYKINLQWKGSIHNVLKHKKNKVLFFIKSIFILLSFKFSVSHRRVSLLNLFFFDILRSNVENLLNSCLLLETEGFFLWLYYLKTLLNFVLFFHKSSLQKRLFFFFNQLKNSPSKGKALKREAVLRHTLFYDTTESLIFFFIVETSIGYFILAMNWWIIVFCSSS